MYFNIEEAKDVKSGKIGMFLKFMVLACLKISFYIAYLKWGNTGPAGAIECLKGQYYF